MIDIPAIVRAHQQALTGASVPKTKAWWDRYLRGEIEFRGVGIPDNRRLLAELHSNHGLGRVAPGDQLELAAAFLAESYAEDKLAGILYLQEYLLGSVEQARILATLGDTFDRELIFDWNTCDWACVRVLGPLLEREGPGFGRRLSEWGDATYLWKARAALVPFTKVAEDLSYREDLESLSHTLIRRPERFAKTAVGWVLREVSRTDPTFVERFLEAEEAFLTAEVKKNARKYLL